MLRRSNVFKNILRTNSFQEKVVYTPVGAIASDLPAGKYLPGQFFIAKNYEYRGLVLLSQETEVIGKVNRVSLFFLGLIICRSQKRGQCSIAEIFRNIVHGSVR